MSNQIYTPGINQLDYNGLSFLCIANILESMLTSYVSHYNFLFSDYSNQMYMSRLCEPKKQIERYSFFS